MYKQENNTFKQVYRGPWGPCSVIRPGNGLVIFNRGSLETCTFIYNPSDPDIRLRTEIREGGRIKYLNEGPANQISTLPEEEQYFFLKTAHYMMWCIENEIEKDMTERLSRTGKVMDCSDCYFDYKAINDIISTLKDHISPVVLTRYLYDTDLFFSPAESFAIN